MTKREAFEMLANMYEVKENAELVGFIAHEIELLDNRSANRKPTKKQTENDTIMDTIMDVLSVADAPMTVGDFLAMDEFKGYTSQKMSALLRKLSLAHKVIKEYDKKKAYFRVA